MSFLSLIIHRIFLMYELTEGLISEYGILTELKPRVLIPGRIFAKK